MKARFFSAWTPLGVALLVFLQLIACTTLHAANYCVDAVVGNDNNAGTCSPYAPWKTITKVNSGPVSKYLPGDTISFQGGLTFPGGIDLGTDNNNVGGTDAERAANPITVQSYGTGRATVSSGNSQYGIFLSNVAGVHITNINFTGTSFGATSGFLGGVAFASNLSSTLHYAHVDNVTVNGYGYDGISVVGNRQKSYYSDVSINSVVVYNCGHAGIELGGQTTPPAYSISNVYIGHSLVYNIPGISGLAAGSGNPVVLYNGVNGGTIEYTTTHDSGQQNSAILAGPAGISATGSTGILFQFNEVYNEHTGPSGETDGGGLDFDSAVTNSTMQYNYSHDNDGEGFVLCGGGGTGHVPNGNNTIRYNISENDGRNNFGGHNTLGGISLIGACNDNQGMNGNYIYNNTVYISGTGISSPAVAVIPNGGSISNVVLYNNILATNNRLPQILLTSTSGLSGLKIIGNLYYDSGAGYNVQWNGTSYTDSGDGSAIHNWALATGEEQLYGGYQYIASNPLLCNAGQGGTVYPSPLTSLTAYKLVLGSSQSNSSPAIDSAFDLNSDFGINPGTRDFYGNPIPTVIFNGTYGGFDIGANEAVLGQVCQ